MNLIKPMMFNLILIYQRYYSSNGVIEMMMMQNAKKHYQIERSYFLLRTKLLVISSPVYDFLTSGRMMEHSSLFLMKPSKGSCCKELNSILLPMWLTSIMIGGSLILH